MTDHTDAPDDPAQRVDYLHEAVDPATASDDDIDAWCELLAERDGRTDAADALREIATAHPDGVRNVADGLRPYVFHDEKRAWESAANVLIWLARTDPDAIEGSVAFLVDSLDANDDHRREIAWTVLGEMTDSMPVVVHPHVDVILGYLDHDDVGLQRHAIGFLTRISDVYPDAIASASEELFDLTRDEETDLSALPEPLARIALVRPDIVDPVIEALRPKLSDEDHRLRIVAADSLTEIAITYPDDRPAIVDDLCGLAEDGPEDQYPGFARTTAISALGRIGSNHPDAIVPKLDYLAAKLDHENELIREAVVDVFDEIATERPAAVRPYLEDLLAMLEDEEESVQFAIVRALGSLAATDTAVAPRVVESLHEWLDRAGVVNRPGVDFAGTMRRTVIEALGQIGAENPKAVAPVVDDLYESLSDEDLSWAAAEALGDIGAARPDAVRPALADLRALLAADSHLNRNSAAVALGKIGAADPELATRLRDDLQRLLDDEAKQGREAAAEALGAIGTANTDVAPSVVVDVQPLVADEDRDVRAAALLALGSIGTEDIDVAERIIDDLRDGISDVQPSVRVSAAKALGTVAVAHSELAPTASDVLRARLDREDEYRDVRSPIAEELQRIKRSHPEAVSLSSATLQNNVYPTADPYA
ncbi:HEAT repeat domain-containing protein [Salinarchaeum laminariae]|uniref:HEAT repeat domain-containing protein n=1 Tax=Salinarchaeum laminariae TaxID=869888 RepID=UPI0020C08545|nr:sister chromatid cohesion protein PDS5 [Salinarchaeum laminariae]